MNGLTTAPIISPCGLVDCCCRKASPAQDGILVPGLGGRGVPRALLSGRGGTPEVMTDCDVISRAFLLWLSEQAHQPDPLEFLASRDGSAVMPSDLEYLVAYLAGLGLLRVRHWRDHQSPAGVVLSPRGHECVAAFGGDVATWAEASVHA